MRRQIIQWPLTQYLIDAGSVDPGSSPYPNSNTPNLTLAAAWANADCVNYPAPPQGYYYAWPNGYVTAQAFVRWPAAPTLARFIKLTFECAWDYSQQGPNNWWFPPDNSYGPKLSITMLGRDGATNHHGAQYEAPNPDVGNLNCNVNTESPNPHVQTLEYTSHPEGGPFTLADMSNMIAGITFWFSNGPGGKPYDGGRFQKARVFYLKRIIEVEDLGGYVDNIRYSASLVERLMRRARNAIKPEYLADHATGELFDRVYYEHPRGPAVGGQGWGPRRLERRAGMVLQRVYHPAAITIEDEVFDLRPFACLWWAAYRIDCPWSTELQGLALIEKGRGFVHTRAQDAWSPRPGDGVLMRVIEGYSNISFEGLAVQGGGDVSVCTRNYDLAQAGWSTVGSAGDFSAVADTDVAMAMELGYLSSCRLTYGAGGATGGRERSLGALASGRLHVRVILKNTAITDPETQCGEWYLRKGTDYWDEAGRSWVGSPAYNPIPSEEVLGQAVADAIPCAAATYYVGVGRFSSAAGPMTLHGAFVDVQHTDDTVAGARTPLVLLDATIERVSDSHKMGHVWGRELWSHERGTAVVEVRPFWRAEDLPADAVKPLLHAQHASGTWQALQFVPKTGSDDLVRFEAAISGEATYRLDCPLAGVDLTRAHILRVWARWLGADGWNEYGPYSVEVGFMVTLEATGAVVATGSVLGRLTSETAVPYARDYLGIGCDETRQLDGFVRMGEVRRNPLSALECLWRI